MMIFVTPKDTDNRFVIYLKTKTCKIQYINNTLYFEATLPRICIMRDFLLNYGIDNIEMQENGELGRLLIHDQSAVMQFDDLNNISGIRVPILTVI